MKLLNIIADCINEGFDQYSMQIVKNDDYLTDRTFAQILGDPDLVSIKGYQISDLALPGLLVHGSEFAEKLPEAHTIFTKGNEKARIYFYPDENYEVPVVATTEVDSVRELTGKLIEQARRFHKETGIALSLCQKCSFESKPITYLELIHDGDLTIKANSTMLLPDNLHVYGNLDVSEAYGITQLPDSLVVNSDLIAGSGKITSIGKNCRIRGSVYLAGEQIEELNNLNVGMNLSIGSTNIRTIGKDVVVDGRIYFISPLRI